MRAHSQYKDTIERLEPSISAIREKTKQTAIGRDAYAAGQFILSDQFEIAEVEL